MVELDYGQVDRAKKVRSKKNPRGFRSYQNSRENMLEDLAKEE